MVFHNDKETAATNNKGQSVPAGVYLYMIEVGKFKQVRKMTLLK